MLIGVELEISGDASGNILMIYSPQVAFGLVDLLMGNLLGQTTTLEEMGQSALGEMCNVAGASFLNSLADEANMRLLPSPPKVKVEKAGELLDKALKPLTESSASQISVMQTLFGTQMQDQRISGSLLVMSTHELLQALAAHISKAIPNTCS